MIPPLTTVHRNRSGMHNSDYKAYVAVLCSVRSKLLLRQTFLPLAPRTLPLKPKYGRRLVPTIVTRTKSF